MANELYEFRILSQVAFQPTETVLHFEGGNLTADDTADNGAFLIDAWRTNIEAAWLNLMSDSYFVRSYSARRATPKPSVVTFHQYQDNSVTGTGGTGSHLMQLNPCVRIIPTMGFKSVGRIFLPGVPEGMIINNAYNSAYVSAIGTWFNLMLTNFGTSGKTWQLAVYSRKLKVFSIAVGGGLSDRFGFQRRRRVAW